MIDSLRLYVTVILNKIYGVLTVATLYQCTRHTLPIKHGQGMNKHLKPSRTMLKAFMSPSNLFHPAELFHDNLFWPGDV